MDINVDVHDLLLQSVAHVRSAAVRATVDGRPDAAGRLNDLADRIDPHRYAAPAEGDLSMDDSLHSAALVLDEIPATERPVAVQLVRDLIAELRG